MAQPMIAQAQVLNQVPAVASRSSSDSRKLNS